MIRQAFHDLGRIAIALAPRFIVADVAPSSYSELLGAEQMIVWAGASERTIYGDPWANYAARAWHDSAHIAGRYDFTLAGETAACGLQVRHMLQHFPGLVRSTRGQLVIATLYAEVIGQAQYFAANGEFPADQVGFVTEKVQDHAKASKSYI